MKKFVFDASKCNGCRACQFACKDEHVDNDWTPIAKPQPDTGQFWIKIDESVRGQVPKVIISYVAKMCQHCADAPCIEAGNGAVYRRDDGLVIIDPQKAEGNKAIVEACPYKVIYWNEDLSISQKCTGCAHLLDDGWDIPRCVDVCATGALRYCEEAELDDGDYEILGNSDGIETKPTMQYLNLPKRFIGGIVVDLEADEVVRGATVSLENTETGEVVAVESDEFGDFWFKQIEASGYRLYFEKEGYLTRTIDTSTVDKDQNVGPIYLFAE